MKIKHEYSEKDLAEIITKHLTTRRPNRKIVAVRFVASENRTPMDVPTGGHSIVCEVEFEDAKGEDQ